MAVTSHKMFIGGELVDSISGETMEVLNPATGEVIGEVPRGTAEDVDRAVAAAGKAWEDWQWRTPKDRMELLLKLADVIDDNADELARLESLNVGKPWWVAKDEPPIMSDNLRFFAGAARNLEGKSAAEYVEGYTSMIRREPLGIVAGIAPWNYPLFMVIWKLGPAIAAGNVQIIKPAEQTPLTVLRFVELAQEVIPPGVLQVVTGDGVPVGDRLVRHPEVRLVSVTGDTATGKLIARNAAETVKRVHLELGGKAPMIVLDDADPAAVAEAVKIGGYFNSGQDCTASSRILVSSRIYDDVLAESVKAVESLTVGDPGRGRRDRDGPGHLGEQQERILGFIERAVAAEGDASSPAVARSATAGTSCKPTIVTDVAQDAEIVQNEVFGPVVTMQSSPPTRRRCGWRTTSGTGSPSSVFSENVGRAMKVAAKLDFGCVWINEHLFPLDAGDAARRLQGIRVRQGHVDVLDGGVHAHQARLCQARLSGIGATPTLLPPRLRARLTQCVAGDRKHLALRSRPAHAGTPSAAASRARCGPARAAGRRGRQGDHRGAAAERARAVSADRGDLGVSEATIRARYARLRDDNILQVTGVTNPLGLGFEAQAMVGVRTAGPPERVADEIARWDEADYVVVTAGQFDILVELVCADRRGLLDVTNRIRALAGRGHDRELPLPRAVEAALRLGRPTCTSARPRRPVSSTVTGGAA